MNNDAFSTRIVPNTGLPDPDIRELWRYRDLIGMFVRRNFIAQYKQMVLGPLWAILQPLLTTVVFTVVFGRMAGLAPEGIPQFLFFFTGNVAWQYFAGCLTGTANAFSGNADILGKVYFPRLVMPISTVLTNLISFGIQMVLLLFVLVFYWANGTVMPSLYMLIVPVLILHMALLGLGTGVIISALTTKYRDLKMLVSFGVQLWMYATPVAYDLGIIPQQALGLYLCNPMTPVIITFRKAFLGMGCFHLEAYFLSWAVTLGILFAGILLFSRVEKTFMDTV